jgi:hypothetical protein
MKGQSSPWGIIQSSTKLSEGVYQVNTSGHGGIVLEPESARNLLPPYVLKLADKYRGKYCFEEDCAASLVAFHAPQLFVRLIDASDYDEWMESHRATLQKYYPELLG